MFNGFKQFINERRYETLRDELTERTTGFVYLDPTNDEFRAMSQRGKGRVRGLLDGEGFLYCWSYDLGIHSQIAAKAEIPMGLPFDIQWDESEQQYLVALSTYRSSFHRGASVSEIADNPKLQRMLKGVKWTTGDKNKDWLDGV